MSVLHIKHLTVMCHYILMYYTPLLQISLTPSLGNTPSWYLKKAERLLRAQEVGARRSREGSSSSSDSSNPDRQRSQAASPFDLLSGIRTTRAVKVNLPTPKVFKGDVAEIVPSHYTDLEDYVSYIGKTAQRAGTPLMDIVSLAFEGIAGKWAQQFSKSLPPLHVNDARYNKEVYNSFHEAFLKHFSPQVRTQEKRARDDLYGSKNYQQKTTESVALYVTRLRTLIKDAGGV